MNINILVSVVVNSAHEHSLLLEFLLKVLMLIFAAVQVVGKKTT